MRSRSWSLLAVSLLVLAVATGAWAVARGDLRFALLLIFPVFYGEGVRALVPVLLAMGAIGAWFASRVAGARNSWGAPPPAGVEPTRERSAKYGGVVLLGPIPIAFGNDRRLLVPLLALALLVGLTFIALALIR